MTDPGSKITNFIAQKSHTIPNGDIVEFGSFDGSSTKTLSRDFPSRKIYAFDTFRGMPAATRGYIEAIDFGNPPGKFNANSTAEKIFEGYPNIIPVVGVYEDTLPKQHKPTTVAIAYLDCDWYISHKQALEWVTPRLVDGAILLFDDIKNLKGARQATEEWVAQHGKVLDEYIVIW